MKIRTRRTEIPIEGKKRQHAPYIIEWTCPDCGDECTLDLTDNYISYPTFGDWEEDYLCCHECAHEVKVDMKMDIVVWVQLSEEGR
jgi:C4-type Zn-finger protein